jgi:hypothetical protein
MTEPQRAIDLKRPVAIDPMTMPGFDADLAAHADNFIALLQSEGHLPVNIIGHMAGLLAMTEAVWRMQNKPDDQIRARSVLWWNRCLGRLGDELLADAVPVSRS